MREWGERVRLVNAARQLGAVYGRDRGQLLARPAGCALASGPQLMDLLAQRSGIDCRARTLGLRLGSPDPQGRRLVLLFAYDGHGELVRFQEAANPPALDYLVDEFRRDLGEVVGDEAPAWFDQADVIAVLPELQAYPDEDSFLDVPLRRWWQQGRRASVGVALAAGLFATWAAWDAWRVQRELAEVRARIASLRAEDEASLHRHVRALAWSATADLAHAFRDAEALWRPGTRVQVLATPQAIDYTLRLAQSEAPAARGDTARWTAHPLRATLDDAGSRLPTGLIALQPAIGGDLHAYYLRFRRETPLPAFAALVAAER